MVRLGLPFDNELLALASASHSGEQFHLAGVRDMLASVGLDESVLQNTAAWPGESETALAHARQGGQASRLTAECSGKHAAMLVTCVVNGWPIADYLAADHYLQLALRQAVSDLAREPVAHIGLDGCGAPLFALTLSGLARTFQALATAEPGSAERQVADAIRTYPQFTSGSSRDEAELIRRVPGLICKVGAEAVIVAAFDDGRAAAVKIDDGGVRAQMPVLLAALEILGVDVTELGALTTQVLGGGVPVGEIRAVLPDNGRSGARADSHSRAGSPVT
jgi:L-asparaginase II